MTLTSADGCTTWNHFGPNIRHLTQGEVLQIYTRSITIIIRILQALTSSISLVTPRLPGVKLIVMFARLSTFVRMAYLARLSTQWNKLDKQETLYKLQLGTGTSWPGQAGNCLSEGCCVITARNKPSPLQHKGTVGTEALSCTLHICTG